MVLASFSKERFDVVDSRYLTRLFRSALSMRRCFVHPTPHLRYDLQPLIPSLPIRNIIHTSRMEHTECMRKTYTQ